MPTLGQYLQQKQREGVDPATIVAKVGLRLDQLTPALLAVDVGVLGAITTNPLYGGAVALQQPQQETLPPQAPVGLPSSGEPEGTGEAGLNGIPVGERVGNAFALANPVTALLPTAAGAAYGAAKEVGRGFAGLVGQEQNYRKALSMLPPLLREDLDEMPAPQRERATYQNILNKREQRNYLDASAESASDIPRGVIGPVLEVTGISPTGYEHLPLWRQVLPTMATRFARGRQFGEGAAIGPGVMVAQVIDEPSKTIRNDLPNLAFQAASLALGAKSALKRPSPVGELPAGFSSPPVEGVARAPMGELPAAALQREGAAIQKTGAATRASTEEVARAQEAVAQGQDRAIATRPIVANELSGFDRAAGAATRGLFTAGMTAATGAPPGFAAAAGAAAAAGPMLLEIAGNRFPKLGDAMTLGKQRLIEGGYAPTPQGRDFIREAVVDPQRARSSVEVETAGSMARGSEQPLLPDTRTQAEAPVYDLHHTQLYGDTFVENPKAGALYGEGAAKAADANIEARSLAEQSKMATAARQRMAQSERGVAKQVESLGDVDVAAAQRRLSEDQQQIDETRTTALDERQRKIKTQQRSGEIPTTSKDLTKFAGAVEERKRTFVKDGQPLYYIDEQTGEQRPVTQFLPIDDPALNESITRLHDKANANRAPNTPEIPASYFERLLADMMFDDSPLLAGSKAIRGWVAKHISKELGFDKTRKLSRSQRKRRRVIEEAIQKELEATAESALRAGGSGSKPRWSSVEIDGKTFNLRDLCTQAAIEFNKRKLPWWQGEGTVRDVAVRQAARRAGKALALKVEEAMFVRKIHSEAARGVPEDAGNPYDRAAYAFADTIINKSRERNAVDFDPVAVSKQILADPMAFINHVVKTTGLKLDSMEPAFLAHQFAKDLMDNYVVGSDSLRQLMERGASEGYIKDNRQIWMHKHVSEPVNVHAQGVRLLSDTQAVEAWIHRVGQHVKGMRTYADFAVHMGNNLSNVLMRQLMDPLLLGDRLWSDASIVNRWDQWAKKGVAEGQSIKVGSTFVSPDNVMRSLADTGIVDTSMIADLARHVGQGDSSLGMWSSFMRSLKEGARKAYIAGDSIPKLAETERGMAFLFKRLDQLKEGGTITLDLGSKVAVQLEKRGGAIVDTATGKALDGAALAGVAAKAAFETPKGYLFDFNNLPTALAVAGRNPIMNVMQPFLSWMWKATDIPGVKPGMGSALLKYDPTFILETTDPKIRMGRIADLAKLSAKRAMVAGAGRAAYDFGDIQGMADASGNKSIPPAFLVYSTERDDEDSKLPFYSAFAFGPSLNAMRAGSAVIGSMFGNKWAERLDPEYDQTKLTENERRRMAGARKWWADWNIGKAGSINDLLSFGGIAGGFSGEVIDYADRKERAGEPMDWTEPMMMMLLSAASGSAVDAARVLSSLKSGDSEFSMWRDVMVNNKVRGAPSRAPGKEDWIRYASRMLFGIAVETKPTIILNADEMARYTSTVSRNVISKRINKAVAGMFADASRVKQGVSSVAVAQKVVQGALADFDKSKKAPIEALEELRAKVNKEMGTNGDSRFNQIIDQAKVEARIMAAVFAEEGRRIEVALKKAPERRDGKPIARKYTRAYLRERHERRRKRVKEATGE